MKKLILMIISSSFLIGCNNNNKEIKVYEIIHKNKPVSPQMGMMHGPNDGHNHSANDGHDHSSDQTKKKSSSSGITWTAPNGWSEVAGNSIRLVTFKISEKAECSFIVLSGVAGGLESNVNRWRGQIGLSPIGLAAIEKQMRKVKTPLAEAQMFKLVNPTNKDSSFLVSLIPKGDSTLFVKLNAPVDQLNSLEKPYLQLLSSIKNQE